jgi:hypothetical protein
MKNSNDTIGNRTRNLPACSTVPQTNAQKRAPIKKVQGSLHRPKAHGGVQVYLYPFASLGTKRDWGGWLPAPAGLTRERPGTHCTRGWEGPRGSVDGWGKSDSTGIRSPNRPARSESLYQLCYPGPQIIVCNLYQFILLVRHVSVYSPSSGKYTSAPAAHFNILSIRNIKFPYMAATV